VKPSRYLAKAAAGTCEESSGWHFSRLTTDDLVVML
jgi:hypothetical protein